MNIWVAEVKPESSLGYRKCGKVVRELKDDFRVRCVDAILWVGGGVVSMTDDVVSIPKKHCRLFDSKEALVSFMEEAIVVRNTTPLTDHLDSQAAKIAYWRDRAIKAEADRDDSVTEMHRLHDELEQVQTELNRLRSG